MAITLRRDKGSALTYDELDDNFVDLVIRLDDIDGGANTSSYVRTFGDQEIDGNKTFTGQFFNAGVGNMIPHIQSMDNQATQLRLKTNNGNRRVLGIDSSDIIQSQIVLGNSLIRLLGRGESDDIATFTATDATLPGRAILGTQATSATHAVRADRTLTAGDGLSGGGDLTANRSLAVDGTVVRTTRNIATGGGLTGGGDLSADRTLSINVGVTAGDGLSGGGTLTATRSLAVDSTVVRTSRSIATGGGLTGGGDLTANRTLSINVGVTAGDGLSGGGTLTATRTLAVDSTVVRTTRSISTGDGLSGGGTLAANRTLSVDATVVRTTGNQTVGGVKSFTSNVGIGTSSPSRRLHVDSGSDQVTALFSSTHNTNIAIVRSNAVTSHKGIRLEFNQADGLRVQTATVDGGYGGTTIATFNANGTLNLGSQATATTDAVRADRSISTGSGLTGGGNLTANRTLSVDSTVIRTTGNQSMSDLKSFTGTVDIASAIRHIGDTNTYMQFHAADQWRVVTGGVERLEVDNSNVRVSSGGFIVINGISSFNRNSNGNVILFKRSNSVVGSVSVNTTSTSFNNTSDYRIKEQITPLENALERISLLEPIRFAYKLEPDKIVDGFLAHNAAKAVPEAVTGEKDAVDENGDPIHQMLDQTKMIPLLTAAVKELTKRVKKLEESK